MKEIIFSSKEKSIRDFLEVKVIEYGKGGVSRLAEELEVKQPNISKIIKKSLRPNLNFIENVLIKFNFREFSELEKIVNSSKIIDNREQDFFRIGLDFSMSAVPILLSLRKSEVLRKKIKVAYHINREEEHKVEFMTSEEFDMSHFDNLGIFRERFNTFGLQKFLNSSELDCIVLPENSIDYNFENLLPVAKIGSADLVMSLIGRFKSNLAKKSKNEYLKSDSLNSFFKGKKVHYVFFQNPIAKEKFEMFRVMNPAYDYAFEEYEKNNVNITSTEDIVEKTAKLGEDELLVAIGFAPLPVMLYSEIRRETKGFAHLPFNLTKILNVDSQTNFDLCIHKRIFDNRVKIETLTQLINEIRYSCKDIDDYQKMYRQYLKLENNIEDLKISDSPIIAFYKNKIPGKYKEIRNFNFQMYIYNLYKFFYPIEDKNNFDEVEAEELFQRAIINHFEYNLSSSENIFKNQFVMELLNFFTKNNKSLASKV